VVVEDKIWTTVTPKTATERGNESVSNHQ
jgi:hypothetical protein